MIKIIFLRILQYIWPPRLFSGLAHILTEWRHSDAKDKGILLLIFAPMLICIGCLLFKIASFVLFVLPSFVLSVLGWLLLVSLFGGGGIYCRERLKGQPQKTAGNPTESVNFNTAEAKENVQRWYEKFRKRK